MKELTDEEILALWVQKNKLNGAKDIIDFARAILKKTSETCNGFCGEQECKENQANCKRIKK
jgi:hypothetical protein